MLFYILLYISKSDCFLADRKKIYIHRQKHIMADLILLVPCTLLVTIYAHHHMYIIKLQVNAVYVYKHLIFMFMIQTDEVLVTALTCPV